MARGPTFVDRASYRRRRLADVARVLPVAGALLVLLPALLAGPEGLRTAGALAWLFGAWAGIVALAALLGAGLTRAVPEAPEGAPREPPGAGR